MKATMSAKSLGTLPVIYTIDELQNLLLRTTMLCEGDTNSTGRRGASGELEGAIAPRRNMLAPLSEGENLFSRKFLAFIVP